MLPSCQVSLGQFGCSQMYTTFSAPDAAIVGRILRKRKTKLSIPGPSGQRFRKYPATHSDFIRALIPEYPATL